MPISPSTVRNNIIDQALIDHVINKIDQSLTNHEFVKNMRCGTPDNFDYSFTFQGSVTEGEKKIIIKAYTDAGWGRVCVLNSQENGERPGMFGVTLYEHGVGNEVKD